MSRAAIPFRLLDAADLARLSEGVCPIVRAWAKEWGVSIEDKGVFASDDLSSVGDIDADDWLECSVHDELVIAVAVPSNQRRGLLERLLGAPLPPVGELSPLMEALLNECMSDLLARLRAHTGVGDDAQVVRKVALSPGCVAYGSGAAILRGMHDECLPLVLLAGDVVSRLTPRPSAVNKPAFSLTRREQSIEPLMTGLEVVLGEAELTLGDVASIAAGDVIRLQTSFCDPVLVRSLNGDALFSAYLGAVPVGNKAIQIVSRAR